jgi:hypothetical protein
MEHLMPQNTTIYQDWDSETAMPEVMFGIRAKPWLGRLLQQACQSGR